MKNSLLGKKAEQTDYGDDMSDKNEYLMVLGVLARGRLPGVRRVVNSALANAGAPLAVVVLFDDDLETYEAYDPPQHVRKFLLQPRHYYVRGVNKIYDFIKDMGADIFAIANNDAEFIGPDWAVRTKELLWEHFPDGMGLMELSDNANACAHFVTRVPFIEEATGGWLGHPALTMYFSDRWLLDIVEDQLGRYRHITYPNADRPGWLLMHNEWEGVSADARKWFAQDRKTYHALREGELDNREPPS